MLCFTLDNISATVRPEFGTHPPFTILWVRTYF